MSTCPASSFISFCLYLADGRVTEELQRLQSAARDAERYVAEAHSWAQEATARTQDALREAAEEASRMSRLRRQLDFLEGRESQILRGELECADLLDLVGIRTPPPAESSVPAVSVASPSFSELLLVDWPVGAMS